MKTRKLKKELERLGIDDSNINIGGSVSYDGCHNLLQRQDGTWEYFCCENSQKAGQKIFDKEDDAAAYFLDVVTKQSQKNGAKRKKKYCVLTRAYCHSNITLSWDSLFSVPCSVFSSSSFCLLHTIWTGCSGSL